MVGKTYEEMAMIYFAELGYTILERNYQLRSGEIDLIVEKEGRIVAVEVKYRSSDKYGSPSMAVTRAKQRKISKIFAHYILARGLSFDAPYRFDVLGITKEGRVQHVENAFDYLE